jgi:hypothetical protein
MGMQEQNMNLILLKTKSMIVISLFLKSPQGKTIIIIFLSQNWVNFLLLQISTNAYQFSLYFYLIEYTYYIIPNTEYLLLLLTSVSFVINKKTLHIACWKINGYKVKGYSKYSDPGFIYHIRNKDIICLLETHCPFQESLIQ